MTSLTRAITKLADFSNKVAKYNTLGDSTFEDFEALDNPVEDIDLDEPAQVEDLDEDELPDDPESEETFDDTEFWGASAKDLESSDDPDELFSIHENIRKHNDPYKNLKNRHDTDEFNTGERFTPYEMEAVERGAFFDESRNESPLSRNESPFKKAVEFMRLRKAAQVPTEKLDEIGKPASPAQRRHDLQRNPLIPSGESIWRLPTDYRGNRNPELGPGDGQFQNHWYGNKDYSGQTSRPSARSYLSGLNQTLSENFGYGTRETPEEEEYGTGVVTRAPEEKPKTHPAITDPQVAKWERAYKVGVDLINKIERLNSPDKLRMLYPEYMQLLKYIHTFNVRTPPAHLRWIYNSMREKFTALYNRGFREEVSPAWIKMNVQTTGTQPNIRKAPIGNIKNINVTDREPNDYMAKNVGKVTKDDKLNKEWINTVPDLTRNTVKKLK